MEAHVSYNYPRIRFSGFFDAWEQRKLGDIGETYTGLSGKTKEDFGHGNAKFVTYMNVFSNSIADSSMTESVEIDKKQNEVKYGDVFFTTSSETPDEVGMSSVWLENGENTYLNSFCFGYRPSVKINPYYMAYMLRSDNVRKNIVFLAQGISRYNISKNKMMEISVPLPALEEQQRIGEYFRNLDTLITLHQRKYEKFVNIKKSMLDKMFPKNGDLYPEVRINGFTKVWERRKLGDVMEIISGNAWRSSDYSDDGEYLVITIANVSGEVFINDKIGNHISCDNPNKYLLNENDILLSMTGNVGRVSKMSKIRGVLNQRVGKIVPISDSISTEFLFHVLKNPNFESAMIDAGKGAAQKNISNSDVLSYSFYMPLEIKEQQSIASCFDKLDDLIMLHWYEYMKLVRIKYALLKSLFV